MIGNTRGPSHRAGRPGRPAPRGIAPTALTAAGTATAVAYPVIVLSSLPARTSFGFWARVAWTEGLILLLWVSVAGFLIATLVGLEGKGRASVSPTWLVLAAYAFTSLTTSVLAAPVPTGGQGVRYHLAVQIALLGSVLVVLAFLRVARRWQLQGGVRRWEPGATPQELAALVKRCQRRSAGAPLAGWLGALRERLLFQLPREGAEPGDDRYATLARSVRQLCQDLEGTGGDPRRAEALIPRIRALVAGIEGVWNGPPGSSPDRRSEPRH